MKYCKNCGAQMSDDAKFCTKCGFQVVEEQVDANPTEQPKAEQSVPEQPKTDQSVSVAVEKKKKKIDLGFFDRHFWIMYILTGVCAYLFVELGGIYSGISTGFTIFMGVMAIISGVLVLAIGILRKIMSLKFDPETKKKIALRDNICFALSIVIFVYALIGSIGLFVSADAFSDLLGFIK